MALISCWQTALLGFNKKQNKTKKQTEVLGVSKTTVLFQFLIWQTGRLNLSDDKVKPKFLNALTIQTKF